MRLVHSLEEVPGALESARREAAGAFGDGTVYVERYVEEARHIEVQVLCDAHGAVAVLGERDCSIQRRHQKLLEEAPSPGLDDEHRRRLFAIVEDSMHSIGYENAGTVEFLADKEINLYFMEMNTRIQVEHPVTEFLCGIDIVKEQVRIAAGEPLSFDPASIRTNGHAIEFRINAEDPLNNFTPSAGTIRRLRFPAGIGVRVDSHLYEGYSVPMHYDSLLAKIIVWGRDRHEAIARAKSALTETVIEGVSTTIPFHLAVLDDEFFRRGEVYTTFVAERLRMEADDT